MNILLLNQYAPPDPSPTARLLGEVADFLRAAGHEVAVVSAAEDYRADRRPARGRGRLRRELGGLWAIWKGGVHRRQGSGPKPRPEVVLAFSSPPGLLAVAAALAWWHGAKLAHWAMDLYPELALALGEIRPGSLVFRLTRWAMKRAYRRAALVVALDEDMQTHLRERYGIQSQVLAPWPSTQLAASTVGAAPAAADRWNWLYSGNLGRAHEWETLLRAQRRLEERGLPVHLVFQGGGTVRPTAEAEAKALGLKQCHWHGYVEEDALVGSLLAARLLVVTQLPAACGLLWPSKLALAERLPRPILWVGATDGAIARRLAAARGTAGIFQPGEDEAVADWIEKLFRQLVEEKEPQLAAAGSSKTVDWRAPAQAGCAHLEGWLREIVKDSAKGG